MTREVQDNALKELCPCPGVHAPLQASALI